MTRLEDNFENTVISYMSNKKYCMQMPELHQYARDHFLYINFSVQLLYPEQCCIAVDIFARYAAISLSFVLGLYPAMQAVHVIQMISCIVLLPVFHLFDRALLFCAQHAIALQTIYP